MSLKTSTVLITGGLGQIGRAIIEYLQDHHAGASIHVLDLTLPTESSLRKEIVYHVGNITVQQDVQTVLESVKPDVVFHIAGLVPQIAMKLGRNNEASFSEINVEGTRIILEESKAVRSVKAFVFTSSADVVKGNSWEHLRGVNEEVEVAVVFDSWYAESKARAEKIVLSASTPKFLTTALRPHAVFSAHDSNIIPLLLSAPRNIRFGRGTNLYDFTFAPNLALAHCLAAENLLRIGNSNEGEEVEASKSGGPESAAGKPFFITNGEPVAFGVFLSWVYAAADTLTAPTPSPSTTNSSNPSTHVTTIPLSIAKPLVWVMEQVAHLTGSRPLITVKELGDSVSERWFDNGAARRVLGYVPVVGVQKAVEKAVSGFKV